MKKNEIKKEFIKTLHEGLEEIIQSTPGKPKPKETVVTFDKSTNPYQVTFSERGFEINGTRFYSGIPVEGVEVSIVWVIIKKGVEMILENNFECNYKSVGGTYSCKHDDQINKYGCEICEINNTCEYCYWRESEHCKNCLVLPEHQKAIEEWREKEKKKLRRDDIEKYGKELTFAERSAMEMEESFKDAFKDMKRRLGYEEE